LDRNRQQMQIPHELNCNWLKHSKRAIGFIVPHKGILSVIMLLTIILAALGALEPLVMKYIFDKLGTGVMMSLLTGILMLVGLNIAREAVNSLSNWLAWRVRLDVNYGILEATVSRLHTLPVTYHRQETVGGIMTKLDRGVNGFVGAISDMAFNVFPGVVYLLISLFIMFKLDARLSFIVLFFAPLPALIGMWAADEQTQRERMLVERWTKIFSRFNEVLTGIFTVKSFAMEDAEKHRFMSGVVSANKMVLRGVGIDTGVDAAKNIIGILARVSALGAGGYFVIKGEITAGTLVAFLGYATGLFTPVQGLTGVYQTMRKATVSLGIIFSILDAHDHMSDSPKARPVDHMSDSPKARPVRGLRGDVCFDGVSFSYQSERPVLNNICLRLKPGECVALVGPSGAGKTTIAALLQRLYDPEYGSIMIDGSDIRELKQRSLRAKIGVVSQDALLFNDTVGNNIAYGRPWASKDEIVAAAQVANAHDFIMRLPKGYDTVIGERGGMISAGEKQRVSIARAIVKDPPILILDEATSSLDAESELAVQQALVQIIESGSHHELLKTGGYYASLVECQSRVLAISAA